MSNEKEITIIKNASLELMMVNDYIEDIHKQEVKVDGHVIGSIDLIIYRTECFN